MGRMYSGDVSGKWWLGVQSSAPLFNFGGIEVSQDYCFKVCGCHFDSTQLEERCYCQYCYKSYEEHLHAISENEDDEETSECYCECNTYEWLIDRDVFECQCLPYIKKNEELFNKYIETIIFDEDYLYEIHRTKKNYEVIDDNRIIADLCFMKQVQEYFNKNPDEDTCSWNSEY